MKDRLRLDFARELQQLRIERGLSWDELAGRSAVSRTYLRDLATGRSGQGMPSERIVSAIAAALDVDADHFRLTRARAVLAEPTLIDAAYTKLKARERGTPA